MQIRQLIKSVKIQSLRCAEQLFGNGQVVKRLTQLIKTFGAQLAFGLLNFGLFRSDDLRS